MRFSVLCITISLLIGSNCFGQQLIRDSLFSTSLKKEIYFETGLSNDYSKSQKHAVLYNFCAYGFDAFLTTLSSFEQLNKIPPVIAVNAFITFSENGHNFTSQSLPQKNYNTFLITELIPYIDKKYNASGFRIALSHSYTMAYESYLLKANPQLFKAYIAIAPEKPGLNVNYIESVKKISIPAFFYLATAGLDKPEQLAFANQFSGQLKSIKNAELYVKLVNYPAADPDGFVLNAFSDGLEYIFKDYIAVPLHSPNNFFENYDKLNTGDVFKKSTKHNEQYYGYELRNTPGNMAFFLSAAISKKDTATFKYIENYSLARDPNGNTLEMLGSFNETAGNYDKAKKSYLQAIDKYRQENPARLYNVSYKLSTLYSEKYKNAEMAIKTLEDAKKELPDNLFDLTIAQTMIRMDYELENALKLLQNFLDNKNNSFNSSEYPLEKVYYQFAACYKKLGNKKLAVDYIKKSLAVNPNYEDAKDFLKGVN